MWATVGRFTTERPCEDEELARTAEVIAQGARALPGHLWTRLFGTPERDRLVSVSMWDVESSAQTYVGVMREQQDVVAGGYTAEQAEFFFFEELACFDDSRSS